MQIDTSNLYNFTLPDGTVVQQMSRDWLDANHPEDAGAVWLEALRVAALQDIDALHSRYLNALTGHASDAEQKTWPIKAAAAQAYQSGNALDYQIDMLTAESLGEGVTIAEIAATILAKSKAYHSLVGEMGRVKAAARAAVKTAATETAIDADLAAVKADIEAAKTVYLATQA